MSHTPKVLLLLNKADRAALDEAVKKTEASMSHLVRPCIRRALPSVVGGLSNGAHRHHEEVDWSDLFDNPQPEVPACRADEIRKANRR
jgi:hypothetical protein